ncbi:hypothetical protein KW843_00475 [Acidovorax sp. sif1233]|uniref:hypothetical protein n=1 Tax=Acidovorax sp. sif1233 TaxID=2854792 RepID=UPI001C480D82|nr:hypothetical protein [Acidovorax sp. sif1233]MBV7452935.1 hypothetical protein [Acidovorax sp. sif1233]
MKTMSRKRPAARTWLALLLGASVLIISCGGGSDQGTPVTPPAVKASLSLLAGATSGSGYLDGPAADALFASAPALALSSTGDLLLADTGNHAIRKLTASGMVSTVAGGKSPEPSPSIQGQYADGPGTTARFYYPSAIVSDAAGNTYVADTANHLVRKIDNTGAVTTFAGKAGVCGNTDGAPQDSTVCAPRGLKLDSAGNLYVGQSSYTYPKIRKITPAGLTSTLDAALPIPERSSFVVDASGTIYVTDGSSIKKYAPTGELTHISGDKDIQGTTDGDATTARFGILQDLAIDAANELYALDGLRSATIRHIAKNGTASTVATNAPEALGGTSLVIDRSGNFVASLSNGLSTWVQKYQRDGTRTILAGRPTQPDLEGPPPDGPGVDARFRAPLALALAKSGSLYVSDYDKSRMRIVNPDGTTRTRALQWPVGAEAPSWRAMAVDGQDNIYVASTASMRDSPNLIYRFTPAGQGAVLADVSTWIAPFVSGGRTYSYFAGINGIAADDAGNVYASGVNGVILKITAAGSVSVLAGSPGTLGHVDGPGSTARFAILGNMTLDQAGNLYVVDGLNDAFTGIGPTIRKITPAGMVSTIAGRADLPAGLADGPAGSARFAVASYSTYTAGGVYLGQDFGSSHGEDGATASLAVDSKGHLYLTDPVNSVIRKISAEGQVTTLVGQAGQRGFVGGDLPGVIHTPVGVAVRDSKLYFTTRNAASQVSLPQ